MPLPQRYFWPRQQRTNWTTCRPKSSYGSSGRR